MKKVVKIFLVIVLFVSIAWLSFKQVESIKADSGWDSSYDSGSSWDSGSDWGSSNRHNDYYNNSSNRYSGSLDNPHLVFLLVIILMVLSFANYINILFGKRKNYKYNKLTLEQANKVIPNFAIEDFNFKAYQIFYDIQMAWMEFDYDKLKGLVTDELYNSYVMQLEALKLKNEKNIMSDFELIESYVYDLKEENGIYIAKVYLDVKFYDYIEDLKTGIVSRGTPNRKLNNIYELTFIRTKEESNSINHCPQCGASVEGNSTGICEYCKSKLINKNYDWVMSKKEKISQE